jgi:16S rRNA (cytosine967-C5)-methyltransferase
MKNKGKLISMDIHEWKLKELRGRSTRDGVDVIETRVIESSKTIKRLEKAADRVLLDVPCSGLGVLRRNPDSKWKMKPENFAEIQRLQSELLRDYSTMTKVGGRLVYATCSFFPSENEAQVDAFLKEHGSAWKLEEQLRVDPDQGRGDGFFAARLLRKA